MYRDLMDLYYDSEARLTLDMAALCRRIIAKSTAERAAVAQVLEEFFIRTDTGWFHSRCEEEIASYHANASAKAQAGKASAEAKRQRAMDAAKADGQQTPNGNPTDGQHAGNSGSTDLQRNSTNQNQNQNQNQEDKGALPAQPPDEPDDPARVVSVAGSICMAMKAVGMASVNPASPDLKVLIDNGADIGLFVEVARAAVKKGKGFAYALAAVKGQMADAAALATEALAVPAVSAKTTTGKHAGFSKLNYHEGIEADGSFA